jgi:hypothetical protein
MGSLRNFFPLFFSRIFVLEKLTDYYEMEQTWTNLTLASSQSKLAQGISSFLA